MDDPLILPISLCAMNLRPLWRDYHATARDSAIPTAWARYRPKLERWWRDVLISYQPNPPRKYPNFLYRLGVMKKTKSELTPTQVLILALSDAITPHRRRRLKDMVLEMRKAKWK